MYVFQESDDYQFSNIGYLFEYLNLLLGTGSFTSPGASGDAYSGWYGDALTVDAPALVAVGLVSIPGELDEDAPEFSLSAVAYLAGMSASLTAPSFLLRGSAQVGSRFTGYVLRYAR